MHVRTRSKIIQIRGGAPASMYAAAARSAPPLPFTASDAKPRPRASVSSPEQFRPSACARLEARSSPPWTGPAARRDPRGPARESATTAQPPRRAAAGADRGRSVRRGAGVIRVWWGSWLPAQRARRTGEEATRAGEVCGQEGKTGNEKIGNARRQPTPYSLNSSKDNLLDRHIMLDVSHEVVIANLNSCEPHSCTCAHLDNISPCELKANFSMSIKLHDQKKSCS
jgi:hypothetical protein